MIDISQTLDFLENAPIALLQTDSNGAIIRANQAALELLQTSKVSYGQTLAQFFSSPVQSNQAFALLKSTGILKEFAAVVKTQAGSLRHVIIDANLTLNNQEEPEQFNFFIRDITTSWLKQSQANAQFDITKVLIGATAIVDALEQICTTLCTILSFEIGIVWRIDERANRMSRLVQKIISEADKHEYLIARSVNIPLSVVTGFPATIWFNGKGKAYTDIAQFDTCFNEPASRITKTYPTVVAFPICIGSRIWGVISLFSTKATPISNELVATLESIGYQIGHFVERIEANEAYLKSQERYYVAITGSNDGIWDWDLVTNEVFYSPRYKAQLGFEENELANHFDTFRLLCHPDDYQQVMAKVQRHIDTKQPYEAEMRCRTKSGDYKWICASGQAIWNAQGRAIRMAGSHRDISERKAAEKTRHEYEQRLLDSESMFRQLAENIREVFWIISASTDDFIYASPAFEELWLEGCDQLYANKEVFFNPIVEDDRPRVREALQGLMHETHGQYEIQGFDLEFRIETKEKEIRWIWSRVFPVLDKSGACDRLYGIAHDITEKKEVERRVSEFYSTVSHELRTPLTSIRAALGLIEGGMTGEIAAETMEYVSIARDNSDRLIRLINDILDIRRLEANKLEMKIEHVAPSQLIESTIDEHSFNPVSERTAEKSVERSVEKIKDNSPQSDNKVNQEPALVLLMEDSDSIALILKTLITRKGYHCVRAANIAEARTLAEAQHPDLLFADINLPDGNGLDFINWLHEKFSEEAIPVIVLSGAEANIGRVHNPELVDWVKKPFETEEILRLMKLRLKKLPQLLDAPTKFS